MSRIARISVLAAAALSLTAILALVGPSSPSRLVETIFDCGHAAVFGVFATVTVTTLLPRGRGAGGTVIARCYLDALAIAVVLGLTTEVVQYFVGRDAELQDVVRDAIGAFAFLLGHAGVSRRTLGTLPAALVVRGALVVLGATLFAGAIAPAVLETWARERRDAAFPRLAVFEERWSRRFVELHNATLTVGPAPPGWVEAAGRRRTRLDMGLGQYPGFALDEPSPDWRGWSRLIVSVFNPGSEPFPVILRVDDEEHRGDYQDRYNGTFRLEPGPSVISIPLEEIRTAPKDRTMDLSRVRRIVFFTEHPNVRRSLWLGDFRLERAEE